MPKDRYEMSRLLSGRPALTVQEKEAVLDKVLQKHTGESAATRSIFGLSPVMRRAAVAVVSLAVAVPAVFLLMRGGVPGGAADAEFVARGEGDPAYFSVRCLSGNQASVCRTGDTLMFQMDPPENTAYFSAFAHREGDDLVIWYFPEAGASSRPIGRKGARQGVLETGIRIGSDHPAGAYELYGVFSDSPMTRDDIKAMFEDNFHVKQREGTVVRKVSFTVERLP